MFEDKIIGHLKELTQHNDITPDTLLVEQKILDSLQLVQMIVFLEKEFKISIKQEDLVPENFATVRTIIGLVEKSK